MEFAQPLATWLLEPRVCGERTLECMGGVRVTSERKRERERVRDREHTALFPCDYISLLGWTRYFFKRTHQLSKFSWAFDGVNNPLGRMTVLFGELLPLCPPTIWYGSGEERSVHPLSREVL